MSFNCAMRLKAFEAQTVANLAATIETHLDAKLDSMSDEEAQRLLGT